MRHLAWVLSALLPVMALAEPPPDKIAAQAKICDEMDDNAQVWIDACTAAIQSGRFTDPARLSVLYSNLGYADINRALQSDNNFEKALTDLNEAVRLDPDNMWAVNNRANARMYRGEYEASLADIAVVLGREPDQPKTHGLRCVVLTKLNRAAEGLPECLRAIALGNTSNWAYEDLGAAYEGIGDKRNAEQAYRHALNIEPASATAHEGLERVVGGGDR